MQLNKKVIYSKELVQLPNVTPLLAQEDRIAIGRLVAQGYTIDLQSRASWEQRNESAMNLAMQVTKEKTFPWQGASNVIFPLVTIAALQFSARSYSNLIAGSDVVRYRVPMSDPSGVLTSRAERLGRHMSWQILEEDVSWEEQHDNLFINLGIVGTAFVKTFFDGSLKHNVSEFVNARDLVVNYWAKSIEDAARKTHRIYLSRNTIYEGVQRGIYHDILDTSWFASSAPIPQPRVDPQRSGTVPSSSDQDAPFECYEQHCYLDLDQDGYQEPYIATIVASNSELIRLTARVDRPEQVDRRGNKIVSITPSEYFTKYTFIPSPDGGFYGAGFGTLLGPVNESVNSSINQLIDAGTMSNSAGGFLGRGAKIRSGSMAMAPWEWARVDCTGDDLRKSLVPLPVREPSMVLLNLLRLLVDYSDRMSGTTEIMVGKSVGQNTPAETSRNMLEQGMQIYNVIFKRVWRSMKEEFQKLHRLNAVYLAPTYSFGVDGQVVSRSDYAINANLVVPAADPNVVSPAQRFNLANALRQASKEAPGYNIAEVEKNFLRSLRVENLEKIYPGPDKVPQGKDPKVMLKEMDLADKDKQRQFEMRQFLVEMLELRRQNTAKIAELEARAAATLSSMDAERAAHELASFEAVTNAIQQHNNTIDKQLQALMGGGKDNASNSRRLPGMAGSPGDESIQDDAGEGEGGAEGELGLGMDQGASADAGDAPAGGSPEEPVDDDI